MTHVDSMFSPQTCSTVNLACKDIWRQTSPRLLSFRNTLILGLIVDGDNPSGGDDTLATTALRHLWCLTLTFVWQEILNSLEAGAHSFEPSETSSEPLARPGLLGNLGLDRGAKKLRIANALRRLLDPYPLQIQVYPSHPSK